MQKETAIKLFESKQVRTAWNDQEEKWYFSIIDVIEVLTESSIPKRYWSDLKNKLTKEGSQLYENIVQLKFEAADGKKYATDCLDTPNLLRLIQSIPSPKAEPFKMWLAKVGYERIEETEDPEIGIDRLMETYLKKGIAQPG
jgi:prophage antirepressor-like protein